MSGHASHEDLPGYSPAQLFKDGCPACETRGESPDTAIGYLDMGRFEHAWRRAAAWQKDGTVRDISHAEVPMLRALFSVQVQLEKRGFRIGEIPRPPAAILAVMLAGTPPPAGAATSWPGRARALLAVLGARIGLCRDCRPGRPCDEHQQAAADAERYRALAGGGS